ncbi:flagellar M-ring protein FliF C-terminal domain-containing protein [Acidocella sp.]|uniref:flagellar M-ring protein FliF C-terminal domain-containing protein n=1 Tax=Acidocella sp. TaxID=50710 RepID=UPI0026206B2B|nr:flagellar M-ring protein FliF C-terminal domain-containing protein [Acidocella sp.]
MPSWRNILAETAARARRVPRLLWVAGVVVLASLGVALWLELSGPPYAVLSQGLAPADGGKVIAQLQKLGIPYRLQAAGNVILVPAPQLAQARLQLGEAQIPASDSQTAWSQLENAPMTTSDLAQTAMATQALELSLQQSIQAMNGIRGAQVFLALPAATPFLADQPKPAASVVLDADQTQAAAQGETIARLVAGAVPGLAAADVTVVTTSGVTVYPAGGAMNRGLQFATVAQIEAQSAARVAGLLMPMVGAGNFQTDVSANIDFTKAQIHEISYGPGHLTQHSSSRQSTQIGPDNAAIGIPGALSNEPPGQTTAVSPPVPTSQATQTTQNQGPPGQTQTPPGQGKNTPALPSKTSNELDQSFVTDEVQSDISKPDWAVKSIAVSVVLNQAALPPGIKLDEIKAAIAAAFAYPDVTVNVLAAPFRKTVSPFGGAPLATAATPLAHALLEVLAAIALLFGLALPAGRRLANLNLKSILPIPAPEPRPLPTVSPPRDFSELAEHAAENIPGVARLLQSWAEEND